jgi:lipopolysaccharide assembly outer membrane protein LptD (OstA)
VVGMTGYAQVGTNQLAASTFVGGGYLVMGSVRVAADHMVVKTGATSSAVSNAGTTAKPGADIESGIFQGNVTINQGDSVVKADEATYNPTTHELQLSGNVRLVLPTPAPSVDLVNFRIK